MMMMIGDDDDDDDNCYLYVCRKYELPVRSF